MISRDQMIDVIMMCGRPPKTAEKIADALIKAGVEVESSSDGPLTLDRLQTEHAKWVEHNFPDQESWVPLLGAVEELGELAHAHIKSHQGIRGSAEKHEAKGRDAIGDVLIYLAHYATNRGWNLQKLLEETWEEVSRRDWIADPLKGGEK